VKGVKKLGVRLGNWLTADEARRFWQAPDASRLKGKRDRAILAVLLGCGLRRRELADLDFAHLQQREEHWAIVDLVGKGGHPNGADAGLGQNDAGRVNYWGGTQRRQAVSLRVPSR
jgi:integrase